MKFMDVIGGWINRYFANEEAIFLIVFLCAGLAVVITLGTNLAPVLTGLVLAFVLEGLVRRLELAGLPRVVSVSVTFLVFTGMLVGTVFTLFVVPAFYALVSARELAGEFAEAAPVSVALTRRLLWRGLTFNHPMEAHRADSRAIQALGRMADASEGVTSFLEKRPPEWTQKPSEDLPDVFPDWDPPAFH